MNSVVISFFKSKKIDYRIENRLVIFLCFECKCGMANMDVDNGEWSCLNCNVSGNLLSLNKRWDNMTSHEHIVDAKLYNPRKERQKLLLSFEQLLQKYPNDTQLKNTFLKTKKILDFIYLN